MSVFNFRTATNKQFAAALKKTAGNAAKLQEEIHGLAMFALIQLNMHTNSTPLADLIAALPKGQRVQALIFWFKSFGACSYNEQENTFKFVNKESVRGADKLDANIAKAEANPYYEWSKEEVKPVFNFGVETIATLIKRAKNASEHPEKYRELDIDRGLLQALERTINDYTANQLTLVAALEQEAMQG